MRQQIKSPCRNGPQCKYLKWGRCKFEHPDVRSHKTDQFKRKNKDRHQQRRQKHYKDYDYQNQSKRKENKQYSPEKRINEKKQQSKYKESLTCDCQSGCCEKCGY